MAHSPVWLLDERDIELVDEEVEDLSHLIDSWADDLVRRTHRRPRTRLIPFEDAKTRVWQRSFFGLGRG